MWESSRLHCEPRKTLQAKVSYLCLTLRLKHRPTTITDKVVQSQLSIFSSKLPLENFGISPSYLYKRINLVFNVWVGNGSACKIHGKR